MAAVFACASCSTHYQLASIERTRILIDSHYDATIDTETARFLKPFTAQVDSLMSPVVGQTARYLAPARPEGLLSNLMPDILMWSASKFGETPDFAVYNLGGIRAALPEGDITMEDIVNIAPFDNKICFLSLTGDKVMELFSQMVKRGGECVSHGVKVRMSHDRRLLSVTVNGKEIDEQRTYRIVTLDYVSQGNDGMVAFKSKTNVVSPQNEESSVRFLTIEYFKAIAKAGKKVDSQLEGRFAVE
jgi:2',3'-cyclic-nucleotide 2'-phosphodiesterase (5'-nucleotidase family)